MSALPPFCRVRAPTAASPHNAEAVSDGRINAWPIPAGALLRLSADGELLELLPSVSVTLDGLTFAARAPVGFVWGRPFRGTFTEDTVLSGTPCRGGVEARFRLVSGAWYPLAGTLAADADLDGFRALADTVFQRVDVARLVLFTPSRDVLIDGVRCKGGAPMRRHEGRLWVATLAEDQVIQQVPCAAGGPVHFRAGALTHARLQREWTVDGATWRAGTTVSGALRDGLVTEGTLDADAVLDGVPAAGAHVVRRDPKGRLLDFVLSDDALIDGFPCRAGSRVRRSGLRVYTLGAPKVLRGVTFEAGDVVTIDEWDDYDAGVPMIRLAGARVIHGRGYPEGSVVYLYGWICRRVSVRLGADTTLDGVGYRTHTLLEFDRRNRLTRVLPPRPEGAYR